MDMIFKIGFVASLLLPLFNIPLILRMIRRKSSQDISLTWVVGVWMCIVLMTPRALMSSDLAFRYYGIVNIIFFTLVLFFTVKYRKKKEQG